MLLILSSLPVVFSDFCFCSRVSYRGVGALEFLPPPEILKLSMIIIVASTMYVLFGKFVPDCVGSNLRGSKFKIFLGGRGYAPGPP